MEDAGTPSGGMFRYIEVSANGGDGPRLGTTPLPGRAERDLHLAAVAGFAQRHAGARSGWQGRIAEPIARGARPVLWPRAPGNLRDPGVDADLLGA